MTISASIEVFRCEPGGGRGRFETYDVEVHDGATVLDAIEAVWARHDRSLTFRHACHHASCGSCGVVINGTEMLPCIADLRQAMLQRSPVRVEPLRNLPLAGDLVVDVGGFFERMQASAMSITRPAEGELPLSVDGRSSSLQPLRELSRMRHLHQRLPHDGNRRSLSWTGDARRHRASTGGVRRSARTGAPPGSRRRRARSMALSRKLGMYPANAQVVAYLRTPVIFALEHLFLLTVTLHAMLGVRAMLFDFGLRPATERRASTALAGLGAVTVAYGVWLLWVVAY